MNELSWTETIKEIEKQQDKVRIINIKPKNDPSNPLHKSMEIPKLNGLVLFQNCICFYVFIKNIHNKQPSTFSNFFKVSNNEHKYN